MTISIPKSPLAFSISLLLAIALGNIAPATANGDDLPSGEEVLQKYMEATGGRAAYDAIDNRMFTATLEIVNAGVVLDITTYAAKPNKLIATVESEATGKIQKGCTGKVAWAMSDMQGPIVEQGASLENQLRDTLFDRLIYWKVGRTAWNRATAVYHNRGPPCDHKTACQCAAASARSGTQTQRSIRLYSASNPDRLTLITLGECQRRQLGKKRGTCSQY